MDYLKGNCFFLPFREQQDSIYRPGSMWFQVLLSYIVKTARRRPKNEKNRNFWFLETCAFRSSDYMFSKFSNVKCGNEIHLVLQVIAEQFGLIAVIVIGGELLLSGNGTQNADKCRRRIPDSYKSRTI